MIVHHCAGPHTEAGQRCLRCGSLLSLATDAKFEEYRLVAEIDGYMTEPIGRPHPSVSAEGREILESHFGDMVRATLCTVH